MAEVQKSPWARARCRVYRPDFRLSSSRYLAANSPCIDSARIPATYHRRDRVLSSDWNLFHHCLTVVLGDGDDDEDEDDVTRRSRGLEYSSSTGPKISQQSEQPQWRDTRWWWRLFGISASDSPVYVIRLIPSGRISVEWPAGVRSSCRWPNGRVYRCGRRETGWKCVKSDLFSKTQRWG